MEVQAMSQQIYASVLVSLQAVDTAHPKSVPSGVELDESILGLLLINRRTKKCVITRNVDTSTRGETNSGHRLDILKTFHNQAVDLVDELLMVNVKAGRLKALESYWSSDYYKLHALAEGDHLVCVMYTAAIPVHTMRLISKDTLRRVLGERDMCF